MDSRAETSWEVVSTDTSGGHVEACGESQPERMRPVELRVPFPLRRQRSPALIHKVFHPVYSSCPDVSFLPCRLWVYFALSSEGSFIVSGDQKQPSCLSVCVWIIFILLASEQWSWKSDPPKYSCRNSLGVETCRIAITSQGSVYSHYISPLSSMLFSMSYILSDICITLSYLSLLISTRHTFVNVLCIF